MHAWKEFFKGLFGFGQTPKRAPREVGEGGMLIDLQEGYGSFSYDEEDDGLRKGLLVVSSFPMLMVAVQEESEAKRPKRPQLLSRRA